ncbi:phosphatase PAP2 family protein [Streptomyces sp. NPDC058964]|uniref:phosphatase PAP2 family protein n=1 Tax=Streptomyces sp. NPDC058964 TaxID=3346681 RepID=UPI0036D1AD9D
MAVPVLAIVIVLVIGLGRGSERWWLPPAAAAAVMALVPALVVPLKAWTARPGTPAMPPGVGYYPSGHTATAAVAYGAAGLLLLPWQRTLLARRLLVAVCVLVNLGVGFGLVRHGYHWPLDVVASWCLCAVLLTGLAYVLDRNVSRSTRRRSSGTPSSRTGPS